MSLYGDIHGSAGSSTSSIQYPEAQCWTTSDSSLWSAPSSFPNTANEAANLQTSHFYQPESSGALKYMSDQPAEDGHHLELFSSRNLYCGEPACQSDFDDADFLGSFSTTGTAYTSSAYHLGPVLQEDVGDTGCSITGHVRFTEMRCDHRTPQLCSDPAGAANAVSTPVNQSLSPFKTPRAPELAMTAQSGVGTCHIESVVNKEEPYAQLIYRALMAAPDHTMVLRDIYDWFRLNTDKAQDKDTKGWQNSIRHNLSMNGAFQKVDIPSGEDQKKGFMWRLTDQAIREGVKSTTRYRSKAPNKRAARSHAPAPLRRTSSTRSGQVPRKSSRPRRSERVSRYAKPPSPKRSCPSNSLLSMPRSSGFETFSSSNRTSHTCARAASPHFFSPKDSSVYFQNDLKPEAWPNYQLSGFPVIFTEGITSSSTPCTPTIHPAQSYPNTPASLPMSAPLTDSDFFQPYGTDNGLFYDTPESADEPKTPHSVRNGTTELYEAGMRYTQTGDWDLGVGVPGVGN